MHLAPGADGCWKEPGSGVTLRAAGVRASWLQEGGCWPEQTPASVCGGSRSPVLTAAGCRAPSERPCGSDSGLPAPGGTRRLDSGPLGAVPAATSGCLPSWLRCVSRPARRAAGLPGGREVGHGAVSQPAPALRRISKISAGNSGCRARARARLNSSTPRSPGSR